MDRQTFIDTKKLGSAPGHIYITGLPGAGKTTEARRISKETGLPMVSLDGIARDKGKAWTSSAQAQRFINRNLDTPHVVEGTQILGFKAGSLKGNKTLYVQQPRDVILGRLVKRGLTNAKGTLLRGEEDRPEITKEHESLAPVGSRFVAKHKPEILMPKIEKRAYDDTAVSGDPMKLMPRLRQIHKFSEFPTGYGPEDLDAMKQSPGKVKSSQGFEYAATGPNKGESVYDGPRNWRPGKIKMGAGLMSGGMMGSVGSIPSMSEQYYMRGMGESGDEENMPIELVSMAGPGAAQGAQMVQMAKRLAQRPTQRLAQRHSLRDDDRTRIIQGLARELEELNLKDSGLLKKPGLLSRIMEKKGQYAPSGKVGLLLSQPAIARAVKKHGLTPAQVTNTFLGEKLKEKRAYTLQGQTEVQGIPIAIENRKGSVRKGTDSDGNEWRTKMKVPYGYIKGTKGADGDEVDAFVGPDKESPNAFVVHQHKASGKGYDEDKVILGTGSKAEAKRLYLAHYDDPKFLGPISKVSTERLKELVASKKRLVKISQVSYRAMLDEIMTQGPR